MKYTAFYSWQSDLPNGSNRGFIEKCIKDAIIISSDSLEIMPCFDYDRDTKDITGSPDICDTIFSKIDRSDLFICDISIINDGYPGRRCPNPNVLLELGYAAKVLGWDKVICMFNLEYGEITDLPFDLNHKRIFTYDPRRDGERDRVAKGIAEAIKRIYAKGMLFNPLRDYLKGKIDYCILEILKQICCLVFGVTTMTESLGKVKELLSYDNEMLWHALRKKHNVLGFFANKDLENVRVALQELFSIIVSSNTYSDEWAVFVLDLIDWLRQYRFLISNRCPVRLFRISGEPNDSYDIVGARNNTDAPDGYLLLEKLGDSQGKVLNSGSMPILPKETLLSPHRISVEGTEGFVNCIMRILTLTTKWLDDNGDEFILDPDYYHIV